MLSYAAMSDADTVDDPCRVVPLKVENGDTVLYMRCNGKSWLQSDTVVMLDDAE